VSSLLSTDGTFEDIDFTGVIEERRSRRVVPRGAAGPPRRPAPLDSAVVPQRARPHRQPAPPHCRPSWFSVFHPGVRVSAGDELHMTCDVAGSDDGVFPDYRVEGELRQSTATMPFAWEGSHRGRFRTSSFDRALFPADGQLWSGPAWSQVFAALRLIR
jgi:hypothetical protein